MPDTRADLHRCTNTQRKLRDKVTQISVKFSGIVCDMVEVKPQNVATFRCVGALESMMAIFLSSYIVTRLALHVFGIWMIICTL